MARLLLRFTVGRDTGAVVPTVYEFTNLRIYALVADAAIGRQCRGRPVVRACAPFKFGVNSSTLSHTVRSEIGCGLTEAVLVDTPCQAAWMAETHPHKP